MQIERIHWNAYYFKVRVHSYRNFFSTGNVYRYVPIGDRLSAVSEFLHALIVPAIWPSPTSLRSIAKVITEPENRKPAGYPTLFAYNFRLNSRALNEVALDLGKFT